MHRRRARAAVLAALFQWDLVGQDLARAIDGCARSFDLSGEPVDFARRLAFTVRDRMAEIDRLIGELAVGWRVERMAVVDRNILRIGVAELLYSPEVPVSVAINEAVELAKRYSTPEAARFVNGILGELARRRGSGAAAEGVESHVRPDS
ncbi:MAG TPA: transcription antitermination factor NusB [Bacillota bacterium]